MTGAFKQLTKSTAKEAACLPSKTLKPKTYWYSELSQLHNKKRYWLSLWKSDGRPRSGILFDIF